MIVSLSPMAMAENIIPSLMQSYAQEGATTPDPKAGEALWHQSFAAPADAESPKPRSCQTCHGMDLRQSGQHIRTGKMIEPMAMSVNPERFTDAKKIEKWFHRNCTWVLGRVCTAQEKSNILSYLQQQ